jgi:hypothetical protein
MSESRLHPQLSCTSRSGRSWAPHPRTVRKLVEALNVEPSDLKG